jgi:hypothetical protein
MHPPHSITIGLSMIVKNEATVITRCLDSVKDIIDYVCICDTGSTDGTMGVIKKWLRDNHIPGEVYSEKWQDFAYNRTHALKKLRQVQAVDYVLVIDADEILERAENFDLSRWKNSLTHDLYNITCRLGNIVYIRHVLFKNAKPFYYRGVLHECLECDQPFSCARLEGLYNVPHQDSSRNQNKYKYQLDAAVLAQAFAATEDPSLKSRYAFYLAQSYRDSDDKTNALTWYQKRATMGGWEQEVYYAHYQVACLQEQLGYPENEVLQGYLSAYEKCPSRLEALHNALKLCRVTGRYHQGYMIGKHAVSLPPVPAELFVEHWMWEYGVADEFSVVCYWSGHYEEGLKYCESVLDKIPAAEKPRILKNIEFFKQKIEPLTN